MLTSVLAKIGIPVLIDVLARSLSRIDHPVAKSTADSLREFDEALAGGLISPEQMQEANRHAERMAELEAEHFQAALAEVNQSLRAEVSSADPYVRRMRPTFGYIMAVTWGAQMLAIAFIVMFKPEFANAVLQGMASLSTIWGVGLSVLGIYIFKRSEDKKLVFKNKEDEADIAPNLIKSARQKYEFND